jgi:phage shock protein PspC (stress-responsive transcriptional regulator)
MNDTRMCPYCAEEVRMEAIKCKHCGSFLAVRGSPSDWRRSSSDRMVAGVCGGLAEQFGVPTAVLRLAFVLMTFFSVGVGLLIYLVLWIVMPSDEWSDEHDERRRLPERSDL